MKEKENKIEGVLFQNIANQKEKEAALEANCLRSEVMPVKKIYTEDELELMRKEFTKHSIEIAKRLEELKVYKAEIMGIAKPLIESNSMLLGKIRNGFIELDQTVFLFDYQEEGVMCFYDANGELQHTRKLLPQERQHRIVNIKEGTND